MNRLKLLYTRWFKILTIEEAQDLGLTHYINVYGDNINFYNCRSFWIDKNNKVYKISELYDNNDIK